MLVNKTTEILVFSTEFYIPLFVKWVTRYEPFLLNVDCKSVIRNYLRWEPHTNLYIEVKEKIVICFQKVLCVSEHKFLNGASYVVQHLRGVMIVMMVNFNRTSVYFGTILDSYLLTFTLFG